MPRRATFSRTDCWIGRRSWSHARFKDHHTELNQMYWSYASLSGIGHFKTKGASDRDSAHALLHVGGPDQRRVPATVERWRHSAAEFGNWTRLNAVMSISSYMEVYLRSAVRHALLSDPGLLVGAPGAVDGVQLLLRRASPEVEPAIVSCTKGDWDSRLRSYRRVFGVVPAPVEAAVPDLERLRQLRNAVGHYFGRRARNEDRFWLDGDGGPDRVSEERLKRILHMAESVVAAFDEHLLIHLGNFETIASFLVWRTEQVEKGEVLCSEMATHAPRLFCTFLAKNHRNRSPGPTFVKRMIAYLDAVERSTEPVRLR